MGVDARTGESEPGVEACQDISPGPGVKSMADVCGSSLAIRLMVLLGRRPVKGEPVRGPLSGLRPPRTEPSLRDGLRPPLTCQLPRQAWPGIEVGPVVCEPVTVLRWPWAASPEGAGGP